ncbi:MAG: calcium/sodium antiporter [Hyphomicrobiales bacterium]
MIVDFLLAGLGMAILLWAGEFLVRGAVNLSLRLGIPALLVSLTVVAFGTSAPELLISVKAVLEGVPGLALGNVVGSNIANVLLILGVPALLFTLGAAGDSRRNFLLMLAATGLFVGLAFLGPITWWHGALLLAGLVLILIDAARSALAHRHANGQGEAEPEEVSLEEADPSMRGWQIGAYLVAGLIGLPLGADLLVDSSVGIARAFGLSETVIGLTLVAIGTSLPELATTVMAALRRHADVALGNVIGSNMFNLLGIIGVAALVGPIPVDPGILRVDLWVMLAASLALAPFAIRTLEMSRVTGAVLLIAYAVYLYLILA